MNDIKLLKYFFDEKIQHCSQKNKKVGEYKIINYTIIDFYILNDEDLLNLAPRKEYAKITYDLSVLDLRTNKTKSQKNYISLITTTSKDTILFQWPFDLILLENNIFTMDYTYKQDS